MNIYIPYFYIIGWSDLDRWYVGCRITNGKQKANPKDLMTTYFTSSTYVHNMIEQYGLPDVKWSFPCATAEEALHNELRVMTEFYNFLSDQRWLNKNVSGAIIQNNEIRNKISKAKRGKPAHNKGQSKGKGNGGYTRGAMDDDHKSKISKAMAGRTLSSNHKEKLRDRYRTFFYNGQYLTKTELAVATGLTIHQIEYRKKMGQDFVPPHHTRTS